MCIACRKYLFTEVDEALRLMRTSLRSATEYAKVRTEYAYYLVFQAIQERRFSAVVDFFRVSYYCIFNRSIALQHASHGCGQEYLGAFQGTPRALSDVVVLSGCVEQLLCRVPFRYTETLLEPVLKVLLLEQSLVY